MLKHITLLLCLLLSISSAQAGRLDTLFQAEVPAAGRSSGERDAALKAALAEIVVRVTGSRTAASQSSVRQWLAAPGRFVEQFRFVEDERDTTAPLRLWVQFDGVALARELRKAGLPYWGRERPDVIAWLAVDDSGQRYLVPEAGGRLAELTRESAQRYGLPLTLPLMDLEDQRAVQFTDVWGGFTGTVAAASQRYRPQVILTARLERAGGSGGWRARWQLSDAGNDQRWSSHAASLRQALDKGFADAGEWLAVRYAAVGSAGGERSVLVEGIQSLDDYARVSGYLGALTPVERVEVVRAEDQQVEFNLTLSTGERNLLQVITLGRVLQQIDGPETWRFRFNP